MELEIVALHYYHNKEDFSCGQKLLDNYLQKQAGQDIKRKLSVCFVLASQDKIVKGFYTLSNAAIPWEILPKEISKKLPKSYVNLPATLLGRLAIDKSVAGQGFGELLLIDALKRCYNVSGTEIGSMAVIVDPIDKKAFHFYEKYGFILLPGSGKMFLPMKTISNLFMS
jgi:GNAT superfamily N-acetyltransferase